MSPRPASAPWYRERWPWLLMLPPALAIVGGFVMLSLALRLPNALVVEDYAAIEAVTQRRFEQDAAAARFGIAARLAIARRAGGGHVVQAELLAGAAPDGLVLRLRHVAHAAGDRELWLARDAGLYAATTELVPGRYALELLAADGAWRLTGVLEEVPATLQLSPLGSEP
jgi:hypothetical protein